MKCGFALVSMLGMQLLLGCATKPVPESRQQQVEQINQTGIYSYQRALQGPGR
ncbi:MAG TPA: hypothetical protein VIM61_03610 [Chthoniobacterales bacterium]